MTLEIPSSIKVEHHELHEELHRAVSAGGRTGKAARQVAAVLAPHFKKEEEYVMPPLGLLAPLARGEITPDMDSVAKLTDRLGAELGTMLDEHRQIRAALENLAASAKAENRPDIVHFAERLALHATNEEEILYPAALLVGRYLEMKRSSWE